MLTTNLPDLVSELGKLALVHVHDGGNIITLTLPANVNMQAVDELVCDALFVDPLGRARTKDGWSVELWKRNRLRRASELRTVPKGPVVEYELLHAA